MSALGRERKLHARRFSLSRQHGYSFSTGGDCPSLPNIGSGRGTHRQRTRRIAIPRYYFHVCNGNGFTEEEGTEFPDLDAARAFAIKCARDIMAADVQRGALDLSSFVEIEDVDKQLVHTLGFDQAVDLTQRH